MPELAAHLERVAKELSERVVRALFDHGYLTGPTQDRLDAENIAGEELKVGLAAALAACARESRNEALWDAAETARRTPFRCHAKDDVDFHSGCVQTQERIVDAIRKLRAERAVGEKGSK